MSDIVPVVIDRLKYSLDEEAGLACVDGYDGQPKNVTIPNAIVVNGKNYRVHQINAEAFRDSTSLAFITIPNSIEKIGKDAFRYCMSLTSVEIPDGIEEIAGGAFRQCKSLTSIKIPNSVKKIEESAFVFCHGHITVPKNVEIKKGLYWFRGYLPRFVRAYE